MKIVQGLMATELKTN